MVAKDQCQIQISQRSTSRISCQDLASSGRIFEDIQDRILDLVKISKMSQAAACDGTMIKSTSIGQEVVPGTLPIY